MSTISIKTVFDIAFMVLTTCYLAYLSYIQLSDERRESVLARHVKGTDAYDFYGKLHSKRFLVAWALFTSWFWFQLISQLYLNMHGRVPTLTSELALAVSVSISSIAGFLSFSLFKKQ